MAAFMADSVAELYLTIVCGWPTLGVLDYLRLTIACSILALTCFETNFLPPGYLEPKPCGPFVPLGVSRDDILSEIGALRL